MIMQLHYIYGVGPSKTYPLDGLDVRDELLEERGNLMEDLEMIALEDGNKDHTVQIHSNLDQETSYFLFAE